MWQTDTVNIQTFTEVNDRGSIKRTWNDDLDVLCDVQDITKEIVLRDYGFNQDNEFKQVFDQTNATWTEGQQVKFLSDQYWIRKVDGNMEKIGGSNHTFVILGKLV